MTEFKETTPPSTHKVTPPPALVPLIKAFHVESEEVTRNLIIEAFNATSNETGRQEPSENEIEAISDLIKEIRPKEAIETLYAAQVVASHMLGMRRLSSTYKEDQRLGLRMIKFSHETLNQLEKRRFRGDKNVAVSKNVNEEARGCL